MPRVAVAALLALAVALAACGGPSASDMTTADALAKIGPGMTEDQVRDALGDPDQRFSGPNHSATPGFRTFTMLGYDTRDAKVAVILYDGRVAVARGTDRIAVLPGGAGP